ncbi:MAG: hypothetical protein HY739_01645 [Desulfobacterales bacterium]|nr:hypothetical protein [Desulfobacterales bacterium]
MGKRLFLVTLASIFLFGGATIAIGAQKGKAVKSAPEDIKIELKSVGIQLGTENILSDKILKAKGLAKEDSKSGWLKLMGMGEDKKMGPVEVPANVLLSMIPKADLTVTFEVTNPNNFDIVVSSVAFGLSEETIIFFPAGDKTEEVWVDVSAGKAIQFEVPMTIFKIPSLAAIAWPAIETGTAEWKARGTMVVISPSGGLRQRFETDKVGSTMVEAEKK